MMEKSYKNHLVIVFQLHAFFQGALFVHASIRSDSKKAGLEINPYYLPTESVSDSILNSAASATSPPHITIDPASVYTMGESTADALDLHENDDYIIPYASQCISDLPSNFEAEYFSELLTSSKNLVPEPILSGHTDIASKTSDGNSEPKNFKVLSGSSILEGSHIYKPSITHSE